MHHKYIITGGPCTGKTTLIGELRRLGYSCYDEIARQVILEQKAAGSDVVPWLNLEKFSSEVLRKMLDQYAGATATNDIQFCDRGIPDIIAYLRAAGLPVHPGYLEHISRIKYRRLVFIAPPWEEIYEADEVRTENFETSGRLYTFLQQVYTEHGFEIMEIPRLELPERARFVLSTIHQYNMR